MHILQGQRHKQPQQQEATCVLCSLISISLILATPFLLPHRTLYSFVCIVLCVCQSPPRWYWNKRGLGQVVEMVWADSSGSMRCVMFNEQIDKWCPQLQQGAVTPHRGETHTQHTLTRTEIRYEKQAAEANETMTVFICHLKLIPFMLSIDWILLCVCASGIASQTVKLVFLATIPTTSMI